MPQGYAERFGFDAAQLPHDLTLALGSASVTPLQMVRAFAVLANGGFLINPYFVRQINDASGNVLYLANPAVACRECPDTPVPDVDAAAVPEATPEANAASTSPVEEAVAAGTPENETVPQLQYAPRVVSARNVWLMTSMMRDVIQRGTGVKARVLGRTDLAGKTGTTNEQMDGWFSGFNHAITATAWTGYDKLEPLGRGETGGNSALPMWIDYMAVALKGVPEVKRETAGRTGLRYESIRPPGCWRVALSVMRFSRPFMVENVPQKDRWPGVLPARAALQTQFTDQLF